jgi:hypothetical protein
MAGAHFTNLIQTHVIAIAVLITVVKSVRYSSHVRRRWGEEDMNYALSFLTAFPSPFFGPCKHRAVLFQEEFFQQKIFKLKLSQVEVYSTNK